MERGDWKRAESLLSRAVTTYGADVDARRNYAETLRHRGALSEALAQLRRSAATVQRRPGTGRSHR